MDEQQSLLLRSNAEIAAENTKNKYTHVTFFPKKSYVVPNGKKKEFWMKYCDMVFENKEGGPRVFSLGERPSSDSVPLFADFTFRFHCDEEAIREAEEKNEPIDPFDARFVREIVRKYQDAIEDLLDIKEANNNSEFICAVMQTPTYIILPEVEKITREKIREPLLIVHLRLQFPYCRIDAKHHKEIRNHTIKLLRRDNILGQLATQPIGDWPDIIREYNGTEAISMYGSTPDKDKLPLEYQYCFSLLEDNVNNPLYETDENLFYFGVKPDWPDCHYLLDKNEGDIFPVTNHNDIQSSLFEISEEEEDQHEKTYWLPIIFSTNYYNRITLSKNDGRNSTAGKRKYHMGSRSVSRIKITSDIIGGAHHLSGDVDDIELCELFLGMISGERFRKKNQWLEIGRALYTETKGSDQGLDLWKLYTRRAKEKMTKVPEFLKDSQKKKGSKEEKKKEEKRNKEETRNKEEKKQKKSRSGERKHKNDKNNEAQPKKKPETLYEMMETEYVTFTDMRINIQTLAWYAKKDAYEQYNAWWTEWYNEILNRCATEEASDWLLAKGFKRIWWLNLKCANTGGKHFYTFERNRWEFYGNDSQIDILLSERYTDYFRLLLNEQTQKMLETKDKGAKKEAQDCATAFCEIISLLQYTKKKSGIIKAICNQMYDKDFTSRLDNNPNLLGFANVVVDTGGDKIEVREGKPQDYLSKVSPLRYDEKMKDDHPLVLELLEWLHKVYTEDGLFRYFMKYSASILKGRNADKIILIFLGEGNNSKSMIVKLFQAVLGPYCVKVPVSTFTQKRKGGSGPNPELARTAIARIVFLQEPDEDDTFKLGALKEVTGGDSYFARFLNDNGGEIEVLHKTALICNCVPQIDGPDKAIMERWHVMPHGSKWAKEKVPKSHAEQMKQRLFLCDPHFEERIKRLAPAFAKLMVQWFPTYAEDGLERPKEMIQATDDYWERTDIYKQFVADCIVKDDDVSSKVSVSELFEEFKLWYKDVFNKFCRIDRGKFKTQMSLENRLGRPSGMYWSGLCLTEGGGGGGEENAGAGIIAKKQVKKGMTGKRNDISSTRTLKKKTKVESDDESEDERINKKRVQKAEVRKKVSSIRVIDSDDEEDEPVVKKSVSKRSVSKNSKIRIVDSDDDEVGNIDSDDEQSSSRVRKASDDESVVKRTVSKSRREDSEGFAKPEIIAIKSVKKSDGDKRYSIRLNSVVKNKTSMDSPKASRIAHTYRSKSNIASPIVHSNAMSTSEYESTVTSDDETYHTEGITLIE